MTIKKNGLDWAKNVSQARAVDERNKVELSKQLKQSQAAELFANAVPDRHGACVSAHRRARKIQSFGYTVRRMASQVVEPQVKTNMNDAADAQAICEVVARPTQRFVPINPQAVGCPQAPPDPTTKQG